MFTPNRTPVGTGSSRRRSAAAFNLTPRRSQFSGSKSSLSRRSHITSLYPRSSPADVVIHASPSVNAVFNTTNYTVESASSPLPVLVNEAITIAEKNAEISVEINENGWAWLVCQRKLFVWRFRQGSSKNPMCKEFTLPPHDLADLPHKAELIYAGSPAASTSEGGVVSLTIVTPGGHVKFWPNIIQSVSSVVEGLLDGVGSSSPDEECFKLVPASRGFLVGTNKGALYHVQPSASSISCSRLQVSHGMLAGIGRRVSSFFFSAAQDVNLCNFILLHAAGQKIPEVVMLTTNSLQKWRLGTLVPGQGTDHMLSQIDLTTAFSDPISKALWNQSHKDFRMWPLDVALVSKQNHIALLVAVSDLTSRNGQDIVLRFVICLCHPTLFQEGKVQSKYVDVVVLEHTEVMQSEDDCESFSYKLHIPDISTSSPEQVVFWRDNSVVIKSVSKGNDHVEDVLPIDSAGDAVLGVGRFNGRCVMLTHANGVLVINPNVSSRGHVSQNIEDSILQTPSSSRPQTPIGSLPGTPAVSKTKIEQLEVSESESQRLQAAFIHFNRSNLTQAKNIVEETFGDDGALGHLDEAVVSVSRELIDDYPAQDPRWAESVPQDSGNSSSSLILLHQLQDKQKAHQLFLNFLNEVPFYFSTLPLCSTLFNNLQVGLWNMLTVFAANSRSPRTSTQWLLVEHGEKLAAAVALRQKHTHHQGVVDTAIRKVLDQRERRVDQRGLTPQDVFYREVSKIQDIFGCLLDTEEEMIGNSALSSREMFTAIAGVNEIFEGMLSSAYVYRKSKGIPTETLANIRNEVEFKPWTVASGRHSIRNIVLRQHSMTVNKGIPEAEDGQQRAALHAHLVSLTDLVLDGYRQQLNSIKDSNTLSAQRDEILASFQRSRTQLITPLFEAGLFDKASVLAEKYHDFGILVQLCDRKVDHDQLSKYMSDFSAEGFSDFLFNWYLEKGKFRKLIECSSSNPQTVAEYNEKLSDFLSSHPKIAWLHQIKIGDYIGAHDTLRYLAAVETQNAAKKLNLLSLSKLSVLFSDESDDVVEDKVDVINTQHILLRYQESLPMEILERLGFTVDDMPVFPAHKLIELYAGDENENSNEVDFKKALDLLQFLPQVGEEDEEMEMDEMIKTDLPDAETMKLFIWSQAILKDVWDAIDNISDPIAACQHTVLFKTLNLAYEAGILGAYLPDVETLMEKEDLRDLRENHSTHYLIKAGFEHVRRMIDVEC